MTHDARGANSTPSSEERHRPARILGALSARSEVVDDISVLHVCGEVDLTSAMTFRSALEAAKVEGHGLIIDLTDTRYMDGPGIAMLESVVASMKKCKRAIGIVAVQGLRGILEIVSLASQVQIFSTVPEALVSLRHAADAS